MQVMCVGVVLTPSSICSIECSLVPDAHSGHTGGLPTLNYLGWHPMPVSPCSFNSTAVLFDDFMLSTIERGVSFVPRGKYWLPGLVSCARDSTFDDVSVCLVVKYEPGRAIPRSQASYMHQGSSKMVAPQGGDCYLCSELFDFMTRQQR